MENTQDGQTDCKLEGNLSPVMFNSGCNRSRKVTIIRTIKRRAKCKTQSKSVSVLKKKEKKRSLISNMEDKTRSGEVTAWTRFICVDVFDYITSTLRSDYWMIHYTLFQ